VEWLLDNANVDRRWCLVHATHLTESETTRLALSGAVAGLCPVTEANLGDGTFPGRLFVEGGGAFGIGTDSNVRIGVTDELRQLEYSQRIAHRQRNVLAEPGQSTGRALVDHARQGGVQALGADAAGLAPGALADLVALAKDLWAGDDGDGIINGWIFARGVRVEATWVAGQQVVANGRHVRRDEIAAAFRATMRALLASA
jgi:formiminoglutamate deiminase